MKHQYIGAATYARDVAVPASFTAPGRSVWLRLERIQRSAKVLVGDALIGEHYGYLLGSSNLGAETAFRPRKRMS